MKFIVLNEYSFKLDFEIHGTGKNISGDFCATCSTPKLFSKKVPLQKGTEEIKSKVLEVLRQEEPLAIILVHDFKYTEDKVSISGKIKAQK